VAGALSPRTNVRERIAPSAAKPGLSIPRHVDSVSATVPVVSGKLAWLPADVLGMEAKVFAEPTPINNRCRTGNGYRTAGAVKC